MDGKAWTEFMSQDIPQGCGNLGGRERRSVEAVHKKVGHKIRLHGA